MVEFAKVIKASIEWTQAVLFRPFSLKKWLILGFIALMAGGMLGSSGGGSGRGSQEKKAEAAPAQSVSVSSSPSQDLKNQVPEAIPENLRAIIKKIAFGGNSKRFSQWYGYEKFPLVASPAFIAIIGIPLILILALVMAWLYCRFSFIFLESVIKNDASIKKPFRAHKEIGNSFLLFYLSASAISIILLGAPIAICIYSLVKLGVFDKANNVAFKDIFFTCLPYGICVLFALFVAMVIFLLNNDFVLPVMYKDKIKSMQAWPKALGILKNNKGDLIKYILIKIGLAICASIIYSLLYIICIIGLVFPALVVALPVYFIARIIPPGAHTFFIVTLYVIFAPVAAFIFYCLGCLYLPFAVFFRTFSLKFFACLEPGYNLFKFGQHEA